MIKRVSNSARYSVLFSAFLLLIYHSGWSIQPAHAERVGNSQDTYVPHVPNYIKDLLDVREHFFTGGRYVKERFEYRLYVPRNLEPATTYPLVIWLNGWGQSGIDNVKQLRHLDETFFWDPNREEYDFFLLAPQSRRDNNDGVWFNNEDMEDDMLSVLISILDEITAELPIDKNRVSVLGASAGANAVWELAKRYPKKFSAFVPMASSPIILYDENLLQTPIWAFHSPTDMLAPPELVRGLVAMLEDSDAPVTLSECSDYPTTRNKTLSHFCFRCSFENTNVEEWLLGQSLSEVSDVLPGPRKHDLRYVKYKSLVMLQWTKDNLDIILTIGIVLLVILVSLRELRRQKQAATLPQKD